MSGRGRGRVRVSKGEGGRECMKEEGGEEGRVRLCARERTSVCVCVRASVRAGT